MVIEYLPRMYLGHLTSRGESVKQKATSGAKPLSRQFILFLIAAQLKLFQDRILSTQKIILLIVIYRKGVLPIKGKYRMF